MGIASQTIRVRFGAITVVQLACIVIYDEYERELKHQPATKDDILLSTSPPPFLDIFGDSSISDFLGVNPPTDIPIANHSQNTPNVNPSFDNGEDKLFIENPLDFASSFSGNEEHENSCLLSTPLFDLSNHADVDEIIDFSYRSCHDPFTIVFDHDVDSIIVDISKPLVYDDLYIHKVKTPQAVEAL